MTKPEYVEGCPCKDCTGQGVGWIKHRNAAEVKALQWRKDKKAYAQYMADWRPHPYL